MSKIYENMVLPTSSLFPNNGQIEGVPKNARRIRGERFDALCEAIEKDPSTLNVYEIIAYPLDGKYIAIGGNMRLRACKKVGIKNLLCKVLDVNTPREKLIEIALKDNAQFSAIDLDIAQDAFSVDQLLDCGVELPEIDDSEPDFDEEESEEESGDEDEVELERIIICYPNGEKERVEKLFGVKIEKESIELDEIYRLKQEKE